MSSNRLSEVEAIFIDDGGVINDNSLRAPQWQRLLGDFLVPRFGGTQEAWAEANRVLMNRAGEMLRAGTLFPPGVGYAEGKRQQDEQWVAGTCELVGVEAPATPEERVAVAIEAHNEILPQVRAEFPGAAEAIRELHSMGFALYTASGAPRHDLRIQLAQSEVVDLFTETYGADITDVPKGARDFYDAILEHAGIDPEKALIVDDTPNSIRRASAAGAAGILISDQPGQSTEAVAVLESLAGLPGLLASLRS